MTVPVRAGEMVVRLAWADVRAVMAHADFREKIRISRKTDPDWINVRLLDVTDGGIRIALKNRETFVGRGDLRSFRLVPRRGQNFRNRGIAAIAAVPVGLGAMLGSWALICSGGSCSESGGGVGALAFPIGIAVPYVIYRLASKADRGAVEVIVE